MVALGFTSMSAQLILLRDFLRLFQGNELVIGLLLASWMFITALGAWWGYRFARLQKVLSLLFFFLVWLPPLTHFLLIWLRHLFFAPGVMTGLLPMLLFSWVILLPFCFVSGLAFPVFSRALSEGEGRNRTNRVYYLEASGALAGGAFFSFFLVFVFPAWQSLLFISGMNMLVLALVSGFSGRRFYLGLSVLGLAGILVLLFFADFGALENRLLFPGQRVVLQRDSPYGNLTLTRAAEQWQLYENNQLLYASGNPALQEEKVHYPLSQQADPDTLLLVFGSWNGMLAEVSKYHPRKVDAVEINPEITRMLREEFPEIDAPWLTIHYQDPLIFLSGQRPGTYDAIVVNASPPANLQTNRYFTREFFRRCREVLKPDGVFSISLPAAGNYMGEAALKNHSILYRTLREVFEHVLIVPGEEDYFLASPVPLSTDFTGKLEEKKLENQYLNAWYINNDLLLQRSEQIRTSLLPDVRVNTGLHPVATFNQWNQWLSHFQVSHSLLPVIFILLILSTLVRMNPVQVALFAGGFASASLEVILLLAFQVLFGYLYLATGMLITVFMLGLYLGSRYSELRVVKAPAGLTLPLAGLAALSLSIPFLILFLRAAWVPAFLIPLLIGSMTLAVAFWVGTLFARGTLLMKHRIDRSAGRLYSADLMGSALGAMLVSALLIPITGLIATCILTAGVAMAGYAWFRLSRVREV